MVLLCKAKLLSFKPLYTTMYDDMVMIMMTMYDDMVMIMMTMYDDMVMIMMTICYSKISVCLGMFICPSDLPFHDNMHHAVKTTITTNKQS